MALERAHTRHIKNTSVACRAPKTLCGVLPHLFLIHSISTLSITLFTTSLIKSCLPVFKFLFTFVPS